MKAEEARRTSTVAPRLPIFLSLPDLARGLEEWRGGGATVMLWSLAESPLSAASGKKSRSWIIALSEEKGKVYRSDLC
ncbi:Os05g0194000 [Oryza sativa Japonica Group]|jgi:hypothetical protein|uniref:Os05g0194000 protein n=1 Tax=Oryza sativa subsp. japonica TaxID=39947 RepID=C7J254_ORYSJ|nr:hypothetical protein DAI22_05g063400 [Oryza sativa Japonica Group]BAH92989.1 Os05g0194000 [Oryza sativa Japonica Group]|eukprot:NP_001174261.1 Os05g0194000 [Oryza sativa Japonica Group]